MLRTIFALAISAGAAAPLAFGSNTIVQTGSLSGGGGPSTQSVELDAFDDQGGTRFLESVQVDVLTSVIGGCTTNGSGNPTQVYARLQADFSLGGLALVNTEAVIDASVSNVGPPSALTFFDTAPGATTLTSGADKSAWIGADKVNMDAFTDFEQSETPAGSVSFSAGGSINWTVTYTYRSAPGTPYCFGLNCPCGNDDPGAGCQNSSGTGALLTASGSSGVLASDLGMHLIGLPANTVTILVIGDQQQDVPFNDGRLCIGGQIWRLLDFQASGSSGSVDFDDVHTSFAQNSPAVIFQPGDAWNFQGWFRDSAGSCAQGSNLTNACALTFTP